MSLGQYSNTNRIGWANIPTDLIFSSNSPACQNQVWGFRSSLWNWWHISSDLTSMSFGNLWVLPLWRCILTAWPLFSRSRCASPNPESRLDGSELGSELWSTPPVEDTHAISKPPDTFQGFASFYPISHLPSRAFSSSLDVFSTCLWLPHTSKLQLWHHINEAWLMWPSSGRLMFALYLVD